MNRVSLIRSVLFFFSFLVIQIVSLAQGTGGIGARLQLDTTGGYTMPMIQGLVPNSPAAQTLKENLFIQQVDGKSCKDISLEEVVKMIRGAEGTTVRITVSDNKDGKHSKDHDLVRAAIATAPVAPPPDPAAAFSEYCEHEVYLLKKKGATIVNSYTSDCGNYFFNFNAVEGLYHIKILTMEEKGKSAYTHGFFATARVFDNNNEADAAEITTAESKDQGSYMATSVDGTVTIKKECVGTIHTQIHDDVQKCRAMFVVVYK